VRVLPQASPGVGIAALRVASPPSVANARNGRTENLATRELPLKEFRRSGAPPSRTFPGNPVHPGRTLLAIHRVLATSRVSAISRSSAASRHLARNLHSARNL